METIGALLDRLASGSLERQAFLDAHRAPFLVTVEEQGGFGFAGQQDQAPTVVDNPAAMRRASIAAREARIYPVAKRAGANSSREILVGRALDNDVRVDDAEVSKRHACFRSTPEGLELVDGGSTNGTFVNDRRLERDKPLLVRTNDTVRFGRAAKMTLLDAASLYDYLELLRRFVGL